MKTISERDKSSIKSPAAKYWLVQNQNGRCALAAERDGWLYVVAEEGTNDAHFQPHYDQQAKEMLASMLLGEIHVAAGVA